MQVNGLCPGWLDTPLNDAFTRQPGGAKRCSPLIRDCFTMGRFASVDGIGESILCLASDRSSFMTGHALAVDGGECIN
jgi:NAD(P)-dependent dehydrogenase (short-subunit alcohol dehydrogenase family)